MELCAACSKPAGEGASARHGLCGDCFGHAGAGSAKARPVAAVRPAPVEMNASAPVRSPPAKRSFRFLLVAGSVATLVVVALVALIGMMVNSGPARGYADTVTRYADHSYENAKWEVVRKAALMSDSTKTSIRARDAGLSRIYGYDDDNLWVVEASGTVFRMEKGHWKLAAELKDLAREPHGRILDADTLLIGGQAGRHVNQGVDRIHRIGKDGVRSFDLLSDGTNHGKSKPVERGDAFIPFAPGITYISTGSYYTGTSHKLENDTLKVLNPAKGHPESVIVDSDGSPITMKYFARQSGPTLQNFWLSATLAEGEVAAVARFASQGRDYNSPMLVRNRGGTWMRVEEIPLADSGSYRTGWLSKDDDDKYFCLFAGKGQAALYKEGAGVTVYPIDSATSATAADLIDCWGTDPEHFWVLDKNGSVWERKESRWRQVVRGLLDDDVVFNHSWVSPDGTIYAVNEDSLYKLD